MNIDSLIKEKGGIRLDLGCGEHKQGPDWVGMDIQALPGVDIVHDFLDVPWPLPDESVLTAVASHVLEHIPKTQVIYRNDKLETINPFIMVMDELWRIMKPDGKLAVIVPHGSSPGYIQDPTHTTPLNEITWLYFDPIALEGAFYNFYRPKPWKIQTNQMGEPNLYYDPSQNLEVILIKRRIDNND